MSENIVKIWFVGNNDTKNPDMELENCEVKRYNGGKFMRKGLSTY
jgi:hypothetical protein